MQIDKIPAGRNVPWDVNVIIEITEGADPIKYEVDKESGAMYVDRFIHTAMHYPCNYGFIPGTLAADGDPLDVLVVCPHKVIPGAVVRCRPIGVLLMEDEAGGDEKVLCVPHDDLHPYHTNTVSWRNLPDILIKQIAHFFEHYKDLEGGKWVKIAGWGEAEEAARLIESTIVKKD